MNNVIAGLYLIDCVINDLPLLIFFKTPNLFIYNSIHLQVQILYNIGLLIWSVSSGFSE